MSLAQVQRRPATTAERLAALERRADGHDTVLKPMAEQLAELFEFFTKLKTINWFIVKTAAISGGVIGFIAVVLTIVVSAVRLVTGH